MSISALTISELRWGSSNLIDSASTGTAASFFILPSSATANILTSISLSRRSPATFSNFAFSEADSKAPERKAVSIAASIAVFNGRSSVLTSAIISGSLAGSAPSSGFRLSKPSLSFCPSNSVIRPLSLSISFSYSLTSAIKPFTGSVSSGPSPSEDMTPSFPISL